MQHNSKDMASSTSKIVFLVYMVLLMCLLMLLQQSSGHAGCIAGQQGCSYASVNVPKMHNRRELINDLEKNKVVVFKCGVDGAKTESGGKEMVVGWELREAPLGPDPLHHHGSSPKKPGTKTP